MHIENCSYKVKKHCYLTVKSSEIKRSGEGVENIMIMGETTKEDDELI